MTHFAYPNVITRSETFLGCGRYMAAPLGERAGDAYALVELNIPNITEVHLAALRLAPESADSAAVIYERRDPTPHQFRGESRDLAYVLALVSRTRMLRPTGLRGDVWCTGRIDIKGESRPFLKAVDAGGFGLKLRAFLEPEQPDQLFIVPTANVLPSHEPLFRQHQAVALSLSQFADALERGALPGKTVIKVQGDELTALIEALFAASQLHGTPPPEERNPYRGLFVFREQDSDLFFGRDAAIRQSLERLRQHAFLVILGASGSGKSSLMQAGVMPALRRDEDRHITTCRIEANPWRAFAAAIMPLLEPHKPEIERLAAQMTIVQRLRSGELTLQEILERISRRHPGQEFLLFFDQCEELYTLCHDADERQRFFDALLTIPATPHWQLALTMRADFLHKACDHRGFADALHQVGLMLGPMNRTELRDVIEQPAALRGARFEEGLTDRILDALGQAPGSLPLLEFALHQLWETQRNRLLTHAAYQRIGGVEQALAHYADSVYRRLHADDQEQARRIFTQLIHPGEGTEDTRRRATRAEIGESAWELVTKLADARLVVIGSAMPPSAASERASQEPVPQVEYVELVHEALIHGWQRLRNWLEAEREFRMWQERLRPAVRQWIGSGRDSAALLRGAMLTEAHAWQQKRPDALSGQEHAFIRAGTQFHARNHTERKRQQRRYLIGLSAACILALVFAAGALYQKFDSDRQRLLAEEQRRLAEQQHQLAVMRQHEAERQRRRAEQAARTADQHLLRAEMNAITALTQTAKALLLSGDHLGAVLAGVKAARQTDRLDVPNEVAWQARLTLYEVLNRAAEYRRLTGHDGAVKSVSFSPNGRLLASAGNDAAVLLWDVESGEQVRELRGHLVAVKSVAFHPAGRLLASGGVDTTVRLWDAATGDRLATLVGHRGPVQSLCFHPDGQTLASGSDDGSVRVWHIPTGEKLHTLSGRFESVQNVRFSPDGALLAAGGDTGAITLWNTDTYRERATVYGHQQPVWGLDFSPDSQVLASGSDDGSLKLWFVADASELVTLDGHADGVRSVRFHPQGRLLASGSDDVEHAITLWDARAGTALRTLTGHFNSVVGLDFHPDGQFLASASDDQQVKVWDISDHAARSTIATSDGPVSQVAVHPDGRLAAYAGHADGTIVLWDVINQRRLRTLYGYAGPVNGLAFSPDRALLASANHDHTVTLWEIESGRKAAVLRGHDAEVFTVAFHPDGEIVASGSADGSLRLWNHENGAARLTLPDAHLGAVHDVAFSPTGAQFASAGEDGTIRLWKTETGAETLVLRLPMSVAPVRSVAFHPDGRLLAAGSGNNTVTLWSLPDGAPARTLHGHARTVLSVDFSPDGLLLASGSHDDTVKIWNVQSGREFITLPDHAGSVNSVRFHPAGTMLLSGGADGRVKLWDFHLPAAIQRGCRILSGYLRDNPDVAAEDRDICREPGGNR